VRSQSARTRSEKSSKPDCGGASRSADGLEEKHGRVSTHVVEHDIDTSVLETLDVLPRLQEVVLEDELGSPLDRLQLLYLLVSERSEE
jgi:hypothetical protein